MCSEVAHDIVHAVGNVVDVLGGDSANRDATVLCHVDTVFLDHGI